MHKINILVLHLIGIIVLSRCTQFNQVTTINSKEGGLDSGYPSFEITNNISTEDGYPIVETFTETPVEFKPDPAFGIVTGQIYHKDNPVSGYSVYLGDLLSNEQGEEVVASLKRGSSPQAVLDINGVFIFNHIIPDRYALMFSDGLSSYLLLKPNQTIEEALIVDVKAGKIIDLGLLNYQDLPLEQ